MRTKNTILIMRKRTNSMGVDIIYKYLADKVMDDLLNRPNEFSEEFAEAVNRQPYIDFLRAKVSENDISYILKIDIDSKPQLRSLIITMLLPVREDKTVKSFFEEAWEKYKDFRTRIALMFRLLDYKDLNSKYRDSIYKFIRDNWEEFIEQEKTWCGGETKVLEFAKLRLKDSRYPPYKAWIYLCIAMGSSDKEGVRKLLKKYTTNNDDFIAKVAQELLGKLN